MLNILHFTVLVFDLGKLYGNVMSGKSLEKI